MLKPAKKRELLIVLKNLVIVEILVYVVFMALALSADWGELYENYVFSRYIRFEIIEFSILGLSQLGLIILVFARSLKDETDIDKIIKYGEHEKLEFKTTFRWDANRGQVNKELEKAVMKTIAAFLNSDGGQLIIGVDDKGLPVGLENDLVSLPKPDTDGFENHFNNVFSMMIGPEFRRLVTLAFNKVNDKTICLAEVGSSHKPVYLKTGENEDFYIRTGNATTPLKMSEAATYISSWWRVK